MTHSQILDYCLKKPLACQGHPFGPESTVVKIKPPSQSAGRIFAQLFFLRGEPKVTLNCAPESAEFYRSVYPGSVERGWHCPPVQQPHFNTVSLDGSVPDDEILRMIDHAYGVVAAKFPKRAREEISQFDKA